jgi:cyclohexadienyl dehydratase
MGRPCHRASAWLALLALLWAAPAGPQEIRGAQDGPEDEATARLVLRVGTSGDYAPFSVAEGPERYTGLDAELARRFAEDAGMELRWVRFRWPQLLKLLAQERFDLAWSGITVRPERSAAGRFSIPTVESGAVALVPAGTWTQLDALDRPRIRIGVNAGGHLERVGQARFPRATLVSIPDNGAVLDALAGDSVQAVLTDSAEAPHWIAARPELDLVALGPFTRDRKAALVHPSRRDLALRLDAWLLERETDGTLAALRSEYLGEGPWLATAEPLAALLAAVDERLSLMPIVAKVKRASGVPLEVPEREAYVLDAAAEAVLEAASRSETVAPPLPMMRDFFQAQMDAAKQIQIDVVRDADYEPPEPWPSLDEELRPALLRIGDRIAQLILHLPAEPKGSGRVEALAEDQLREPRLARSSRREIVTALERLMPEPERSDQARAKARAASPANTGSATQTP